MKKCPECSTENIDAAKLCTLCGSNLNVAVNTCPFCEMDNPKGAVHCMHCGQAILHNGELTNKLFVEWRFVNEIGKYVYVVCDNCHKGFKVLRERCREIEDGYTLDPPDICPACDAIARKIYYAGTEPILRYSILKAEQERKAFSQRRLRKIILYINIMFLIIATILGIRGWIQGDFDPRPTATPFITSTPRPKPPERPQANVVDNSFHLDEFVFL